MDPISYPEFSRIYNSMEKESNQLYRLLSKHYGISESVSWILYVLREEDRPLTQTELCNTLYLSKQTVNSALKSLEADGYIRLECASGNRRNKNIYLTEAGLALAMRTVDNVFKMEERAFLRLSASERAAILSLGQKHLNLLREEAGRLLSGKSFGG